MIFLKIHVEGKKGEYWFILVLYAFSYAISMSQTLELFIIFFILIFIRLYIDNGFHSCIANIFAFVNCMIHFINVLLLTGLIQVNHFWLSLFINLFLVQETGTTVLAKFNNLWFIMFYRDLMGLLKEAEIIWQVGRRIPGFHQGRVGFIYKANSRPCSLAVLFGSPSYWCWVSFWLVSAKLVCFSTTRKRIYLHAL
jgi:hypothetical protein